MLILGGAKFFVCRSDYHNRKKEINDFNAANRWVKRGIAIVPLKYHLGYFGTSHAIVSIFNGDGSVAVSVGSIEMGQGLNTKVAQTVAHTLEIPLEKVQIKPSNSLTAPNAVVTGGSIGSEISCFVSLSEFI
jgi:xanthine dehydrogenase/oxidase